MSSTSPRSRSPLGSDGGDAALLPVPWLSSIMGRDVVACKLDETDLDKINKLTQMRWATVEFGNSEQQRVVLKLCKPGDAMAKMYGLAREGNFYSQWKELLSMLSESPGAINSEARENLVIGLLPKVWHAEADMTTAFKKVLMEDLTNCVQAGYFFGPGNPNNWGKDLEKEKKCLRLDPVEVTRLAFSAAAKLHASFWKCEALLVVDWLRSSSWLTGGGQQEWDDSQNSVKEGWSEVRSNIGKTSDGSEEVVKWDPLLVNCMDAAIAKTSWQAFQKDLEGRKAWFTMTHGDFHPANMMLRPQTQGIEGEETRVASLLLLDWEVVGLGSGPQDLGQYMISHVDPQTRAIIEKDAVWAYYDELISLNSAIATGSESNIAFSREDCWAEYVNGGLGRWLWFIPRLASFCPTKMTQYFADQVTAFIRDHGVVPETVPMPRA